MNKVLVFILLAIGSTSFAQPGSLREKILEITTAHKALTGVAIIGPAKNDTLTVNNHHHYPMQSVYKFHLALAILDKVDRGELTLDQMIDIDKEELMVETWSPMRDDYPGGDIEISLRDLLRYTVAKSDNNGCDFLLRLYGGTKPVDTYIRGLGISDVSIAATEAEMHREWEVQYTNWSTPLSAALLLQQFRNGEILSDASRKVLWDIMVETSTGANRIRGLLPSGTIVGNKTGTSGPNDQNISAATNDIGIVQLPDGRRFMLAVFVTDSHEEHEVNERIIAEISKAAWDHFQSPGR